MPNENQKIAPALLAWFARCQRVLPFRSDPTPYHVWVSEIMLQQTRVTAVLPYYERFMAALPDIPSLAACDEERLHKLWEGLGYYSRVRNLQKAARVLCEWYHGRLPADFEALRTLPGIGEYTAGAVASIGFGIPVPAVDGNVLRVFSRLYNEPGRVTDTAVKHRLTAHVMEHQPPDAPGDYNQALMELGALVCVPNGAPLCGECPLAELCEARRMGTAASLPNKAAPRARRVKEVAVALVQSPNGWLLQRRPETGLLAGLWQPMLWEEWIFQTPAEMADALAMRGVRTSAAAEESPAKPMPLPKSLPPAKHIFSHLEWNMTGWYFRVPAQRAPSGCVWATREELQKVYTLPGAFKVYREQMLK